MSFQVQNNASLLENRPSSSANCYENLPIEVQEVGQLHLEGNVIPHTWYGKILLNNGKVDLISIVILSEIIYWYRPTYIRDEDTGQIVSVKKKFKGHALQKTKKALACQFGFTERQVKDSLLRLEKMGFIMRDYRTILLNNNKMAGNVLFIKINAERIKKSLFDNRLNPKDTLASKETEVKTDEEKEVRTDDLKSKDQIQPYDVKTSEGVLPYDVKTSDPMTLKRQTNTEITVHVKRIDSARPKKRVKPLSFEAQEIKETLQKALFSLKPDRRPIANDQAKRYIPRLIKQHNGNTERIKKVIEWIFYSNQNSALFWQGVVQGPQAFYNNFDQMEIQMNYKSPKEKEKEKAKTELEMIEKHRDWANRNLLKFKFKDDKIITPTEYGVDIYNGRNRFPWDYKEPKFIEYILDKLETWGYRVTRQK
ncbi:MAG: hypothetical protein ACRDAI_01220 [Candidatus Rhabdochlamydia sp.]